MEDINSSSKRFKDLKEARCSDDGVDRISDLPDLVLLHILSFLPTNDSVGTSVLSHRWRYLFTRVSKFDFDQSLFPRSDPYAYDERYHYPYLRAGVKCPSSLKDFVDRVLLVWDSSHISSFRLKCRPAFDCSNIDVWIVFALRRGVAELDIFTYEDKLSILPPSLFSCKTLVVLKLRGGFQMKFPKSFKLPKLKTLQLSTVKFEDDYSLNRLLSGCPLLEDLVLLGGWEDVEDLIVSSPSVRRFTLDRSDGFLSESFHRSSISLDLPNLLYFNYVDYLAIHYILKNVNSVKEARIDILSDLDGMMCETQKFCTAFRELVNGFSAAKLLFLGGTCLKVLKFCKNGLPTFNSLIRLDLGCARHVSFRGSLPDLLNSAPNLEILVFSEGILQCERDDDFDDDKTHWSRQRKAPPCLSRMKLIILHLFHGYNEELRIAKYLLRHGKGLQMLVLDWITTTHDNDIKHAKEFRKLKKLADSKGCMLANLKMWSDYGMALELDG